MKNAKIRNAARHIVLASIETIERRLLMSATPINQDSLFSGGLVSGVQNVAASTQLVATNPVTGDVFVVGTSPSEQDGESAYSYEVQKFTAAGAIDPSYGGTGFAAAPVNDEADAIAVQPDGKVLVLADGFSSDNTGRDFYLTRFTATGAIDTSFGTDGTVTYFQAYSPYSGSVSESLTVLPDGDIAIPESVVSNNVTLAAITAYTSAGTLDNSFGVNGVAIGAGGTFEDVTADSAGNLIAVGTTYVSMSSPVGAEGTGFIERFTPAGKLDSTFGNNGTVLAPNASTFSTAFVSSTGISVAGWLQVVGSSNELSYALELNHFTPTGQVDTTFGAGKGYVAPFAEYGPLSVFQSDGKLVTNLQGSSTSPIQSALVRLNTDGSIDTTFGTSGYVTVPALNSLALEPDNQAVFPAAASPQGVDFSPERLLTNGSPDLTFGPGGVAAGAPLFGSADAIAELPNGQTLVTGTVTLNDVTGLYIDRYTFNGQIDSTFAPGQGYGGTNGYIFIGPRTGVQSGLLATANQLAVDPAGDIYLDEMGVGILRFTSAGVLDKTFGTSGSAINISTKGFLLEPNGQILDNSTNGTITRLNANGTVDTTFGSGGSATLPAAFNSSNDAITLQTDGKILIGGDSVSTFTTTADLAVLRLNSNGSVDTTFGTAGIAIADQLTQEQQGYRAVYSATVTGLAVLPNGTIVAAGSGGISGDGSFQEGPTVAEFLTTGQLNPAFGQGGQTSSYSPQYDEQSSVVGLVVESDGTLVVGGSEVFGFPPGSDSYLYVLRYNSDGSINNTFANQIIPGDPNNIGGADIATDFAAGLNGTVVLSANLTPNITDQIFPGLARYIVGPTTTAVGTGSALTGAVIGSTGSYGGKGNTIANAFDGNLNTFFDAKQASGDWAGLDLGSATTITQISFAPRAGWESRMVGGVFQGSNSATFSSGVTTLYTVTTTPIAGQFTTVNVTTSGSFRYVRYLGPTNSYCNIAEAQFFSTPAKLTGAIIGTSGSYENQGNTIANVFDGNLTTFFDAPTVSGAWVGLDLGSAQTVTQVSFAPRDSGWSGFAQRMIGGEIQASNTADFSSGVVTVYTINTAPPVEKLTTVALPAVGAYRYWRYIGTDGSSCNIAELEFMG